MSETGQIDAFSVALGVEPSASSTTLHIGSTPGANGVGLSMPVIDRAAVEKAEPETPGEVLQSDPLTELARHVRRVFDIAKIDRSEKGITEKLTAIQRMVRGEYSPEEKNC